MERREPCTRHASAVFSDATSNQGYRINVVTLNLVIEPTPNVPWPRSRVPRSLSSPPKNVLLPLGEDSSTALSITTLLHGLTQKGMIVVCSIHQPRSNIFSEFDKVLLLRKGQTVYYGEQGSVVKYFNGSGGWRCSTLSSLRTRQFFAWFRPAPVMPLPASYENRLLGL